MLSFFFAGSETALMAFSRARMLRLEKKGNRKAGIVNRLLEARERLIGALLLGNNAVNIAASSLATSVFLLWFGDVGVIYATVVMTVLVVVFAEVLPKTIAINDPDRIALLSAKPMQWVMRLLGPVLIAIEARGALDPRLAGSRSATTGRFSPRTRNCAARSICCTTRAASRNSTATCSAGCSTCATSRCPT